MAGGGGCAGDDPAFVADGLILLPTRRSARALAEAFLRASGGRPLLLPRITAIGAADEVPLALVGALDVPPAIGSARRLALLTRLVMQRAGSGGVDRAWTMAVDLAELLDEAARAGVDLAAALPDAAGGDHAAHWERTLAFLEIVTAHWPAVLAAESVADPVARQVALLEAQAAAWRRAPPETPVWAAGVTSAMPAVARLLRVIAEMPAGKVILPHLDFGLDDATWSALSATHPQAGLSRLLLDMGARRGDVEPWPDAPVPASLAGRMALVSRALLPAEALSAWQDVPPAPADPGLRRLTCADSQEEAVAVALVLRDAIERPGAVAALVTPDRALARRVSAELLRFGIVTDDSAGEPLADTPPAVLLRLLARALDEAFGPVALLALLKHPLVGLGMQVVAARAGARALERDALRGPAPPAGLAALRGKAQARAMAVLDRLEACLEDAVAMQTRPLVPVSDRLRTLVAAAEFLAATDERAGPERLWAAEEGEALATALSELLEAAEALPPCGPEAIPGLLDAMLAGIVVRTRRALRGRDEAGDGIAAGREHPRVFVWGLLEARLQAVDVLVLGGLVEGIWPPATDPGPWMSRPMRARAGMPSPEERIGQAAHDFAGLMCAAQVVVLSCPRRVGRSPAVPARWLDRLDACLLGARDGGGARVLQAHPAAGWARMLDQPAGAAVPASPPEPSPPVRLRPRKLSLTEIEIWREDPYAIHARHVLKLRPVRPLEEDAEAQLFGVVVHDGLDRFWKATDGVFWPANAQARLEQALTEALGAVRVRPGVAAWWRPRLSRIAAFVVAEEIAARAVDGVPLSVLTERTGIWRLAGSRGGFELVGRADRIDVGRDGALIIHDYKTGQMPSNAQVLSGRRPQLTLMACMAAEGALPDVRGVAGRLQYWRLSATGASGLRLRPIKGTANKPVATAIEEARVGLLSMIANYDDDEMPYLAQPDPDQAPSRSDYSQLARVAEWVQNAGEPADDDEVDDDGDEA